ncbi:MAG: hypothetical protein V4709_12760 [Pseudomonadota bacterium]
MRTTHPLHLLAAAALVMAFSSACSKPASESTPKTVAATSSAFTPDLSDDYCKLLPPERIAEYQAAHDAFSSEAGLVPQFEKGHSFKDGDSIQFQWGQAATQNLNITVTVLRNCSMRGLMNDNLYETPPGSGVVAVPLQISGGGSSYPDGSPALVEVSRTEIVDAAAMKAKTTIIGRYTVRVTGPKS